MSHFTRTFEEQYDALPTAKKIKSSMRKFLLFEYERLRVAKKAIDKAMKRSNDLGTRPDSTE